MRGRLAQDVVLPLFDNFCRATESFKISELREIAMSENKYYVKFPHPAVGKDCVKADEAVRAMKGHEYPVIPASSILPSPSDVHVGAGGLVPPAGGLAAAGGAQEALRRRGGARAREARLKTPIWSVRGARPIFKSRFTLPLTPPIKGGGPEECAVYQESGAGGTSRAAVKVGMRVIPAPARRTHQNRNPQQGDKGPQVSEHLCWHLCWFPEVVKNPLETETVADCALPVSCGGQSPAAEMSGVECDGMKPHTNRTGAMDHGAVSASFRSAPAILTSIPGASEHGYGGRHHMYAGTRAKAPARPPEDTLAGLMPCAVARRSGLPCETTTLDSRLRGNDGEDYDSGEIGDGMVGE